MSDSVSNLQARFKLEEAKFFYEQMEFNFQDRTKFLYYLDAFLSSARSVTLVFQKEFKNVNAKLMKWYESKIDGWEENKLMKLFVEMRNISIHAYTPKAKITASVSISANAILVARVSVKKISPNGTVEEAEVEPHKPTKLRKPKKENVPAHPKIVNYSFHELPDWFDENPDVIYLCKRYLDELEKFVTEAESMVKKKE